MQKDYILIDCQFKEGHGIFSGLAHWIKGGVFFWLGLLTLGRWCGSFGDLGWVSSFFFVPSPLGAVASDWEFLLTKVGLKAWNVRPKQSSQIWRPTAEFVEGFLIFFYGSTNIFLEHLGNAGEAFSAQDLEHVSITVLFIGGGAVSLPIAPFSFSAPTD